MRLIRTAIFSCLVTSVGLQAGATLVTNPGTFTSNDSVNWGQLNGGVDSSPVPSPFVAVSGGGIGVVGTFAGGSGVLSIVCGAPHCSYTANPPGFNPGDYVLVSDDGSGGATGPLTLTFSTPVSGAALYIQVDASATFTADVQAFDSSNTLLGGGSSGSDALGDPTFIGVSDTTAEISRVVFDLSSCTDISPSVGCNPHDFAVDSLLLNTGAGAVPEPSALFSSLLLVGGLILFKTLKNSKKSWTFSGVKSLLPVLFCAAILVPAVFGQDGSGIVALPADPSTMTMLSGSDARAAIGAGTASGGASSFAGVGTPLPTWNYSLVSPRDGNTYTGFMIGGTPFNRFQRTTNIPVRVIPLRITLNFGGGTIVAFDPTVPDAGCLGANPLNTALSLTQQGPIFNNATFAMNGVNVGNTQYLDAFQRANFWSYVQLTGNAYHTMLSPVVTAPMQNITLSANSSDAALYTWGGGVDSCGVIPLAPGSTNANAAFAGVNINTLDPILRSIMTTLGVTKSEFPFFVIYKTYIFGGTALNFGNCCILGYHDSIPEGSANAQTYGISLFGDSAIPFAGAQDTAIMAHEVGEWMDDPGILNFVPQWGGIGQVGGCQPNLEVGDPLTGNAISTLMPNGFTYHLQELAFFSWFLGNTPSYGAGGKYSSNGTFGGFAKLCPPGGTN